MVKTQFKVPVSDSLNRMFLLSDEIHTYVKPLELRGLTLNPLNKEFIIKEMDNNILPAWKIMRDEFVNNRPFKISNLHYELIDEYIDMEIELINLLRKFLTEDKVTYLNEAKQVARNILMYKKELSKITFKSTEN